MRTRSSLSNRLVIIMSCVALAAGTIGCAASLLKETADAQRAIQAAQEARAEQYASDLLRDAKASLDEAMQLGSSQQHEAKELLLRALMQAEVASILAKERATAEKLQATREERNAAKAEVETAQKAAEAAKAELSRPSSSP